MCIYNIYLTYVHMMCIYICIMYLMIYINDTHILSIVFLCACHNVGASIGQAHADGEQGHGWTVTRVDVSG